MNNAITPKCNTFAVAKAREDYWRKIADSVNA